LQLPIIPASEAQKLGNNGTECRRSAHLEVVVKKRSVMSDDVNPVLQIARHQHGRGTAGRAPGRIFQ
jgi:hypothetical protein